MGLVFGQGRYYVCYILFLHHKGAGLGRSTLTRRSTTKLRGTMLASWVLQVMPMFYATSKKTGVFWVIDPSRFSMVIFMWEI